MHVCWLIFGVYGMQSDLASLNVVLEVVELDIDVLGPGPHFWKL